MTDTAAPSQAAGVGYDLQAEIFHKNGTTRARVIARDAQKNPVDAEVLTAEGSTMRLRFARRLATKEGSVIDGKPDPVRVEHYERRILSLVDVAPQAPEPEQPDESAEERLSKMPADVKEEAENVLRSPKLMERVGKDIDKIGVAGETDLSQLLYLIYTSRMLDRPNSAIVQGLSSSGKSYVVERTAALIPPEAIIRAQQMTPQALFHMKPGSLKHRLIIAGERSRAEDDDVADSTRALREMLSSRKLSKLMPVKGEHGIETIEIEQDGPIAYVETTTKTRIFEEDLNRCILLTTDEQPEQTKLVLQKVARGYQADCDTRDSAANRIIEIHHAMQRMLATAPADVDIPYAAKLAGCLSTDRIEARRAIGHILSTIATVALLHRFQRQEREDGRIIATAADYAVTCQLLKRPMQRSLGRDISDGAHRFYTRLCASQKTGEEFTTSAVYRTEKVSREAVRGWLLELSEAGYVELVYAGQGRRASVWKIPGDSGAGVGKDVLPSWDEIESVCGDGGSLGTLAQEVNPWSK